MNTTARLMFVCCAALSACGDDDSGNNNRPPDAPIDSPVSQTVGAAGGTVTVPGGPTVTIPPGALAADVLITITPTNTQRPGAVTDVWHFAPDGLTFATPATVFFPVANQMNALSVYWSQAGGGPAFDELASTQTIPGVSAPITHFSDGFVAPVTPPTAVGTDNTFVVSAIQVPANNTEARTYGIDLDGDNVIDNQLGMVFATLTGQGYEITAATNEAVDRGTTLVLANLITTSFTAGQGAGFRTYLGATPSPAPCSGSGDTQCRKHLTGTGTFSVSAMNPMNTPLVGNFLFGTFKGGPGHAVFQMALASGRAMTLDLIGARVKITAASATGLTGVIAGGLTQAEIDATFIPEFAYAANQAIAADCNMLSSPPSCGCSQNSTGASQVGLFDTNHNCSVSEAEVKGNSLIVSLLAPDIIVEGQQVLSVGFGFTAVKGTFTP
jgi:hypothetical protein